MKKFILVSLLLALTGSIAAAQSKSYLTPLTLTEMAQIKGKGTPLQNFLALATKTQVGPGVYVYTYSQHGDPISVTATWNTGSTSGTATVVK